MYRRAIVFCGLLLTMCGQDPADTQRIQSPADSARLALSPGPVFQFPVQMVGASVAQVFTVTNTGQKTATQMQSDFGLSITFGYSGGYPGAAGTCGTSLASGQSCTLEVTFSPQYASEFEQVLKVSFVNGYSAALTDFPILRGRGQ
jgi:hypothetical protein